MKKVFKSAFGLTILIFACTVGACEDDSNVISNPDDIVFPDTLVSFKQHVQPLFNLTCARANCHDGKGESVPPNLTYYEGIRFGPPTGLVDPGKPESSILVITIEGGHGPYQLSRNHVNGIKQWIVEGAKDN